VLPSPRLIDHLAGGSTGTGEELLRLVTGGER
jgi:hypothetical protein